MVRLMDMGLERLKSMIMEMADYSEATVFTAINSYSEGQDLADMIYARSLQLRKMEDDVNELAVEIISRYQPVASDVRFLKSCMEISYGFSRFGRYAFDISQVLRIVGNLSTCDKTEVLKAGEQAKEMIKLSIQAFVEKNVTVAKEVREMDDVIDKIYVDALRQVSTQSNADIKCSISSILILRYLERIADHATYIGDSVVYVVSGQQVPKMNI
ncbi:MAG: PhoU domain-containing protein [Nitrososphaeria archaeon]|jgi:phosphate transport system protein